MMSEQAYLFRHATVCDAAYQLQPPTDRAALHLLALRASRSASALERARHALHSRAALPESRVPTMERLAARWLAAAIKKAREDLNHNLTLELFRQLRTLQHARPRDTLAAINSALGTLRTLGRTDEARALLQEGLALAEASGAAGFHASMRLHLAELLADTGDLEAAAKATQVIADEAAGNGHRANELSAVGNLAVLLDMLGRAEDSLAAFQRALSLADGGANSRASATIIGNIGISLVTAGRYTEARAHLEDAMRRSGQIDDVERQGYWHGWLGTLEMKEGNPEAARKHLETGVAITRRIGFRVGEAAWIAEIAKLDASLGREDAARAGFEAAITIAREAGASRLVKNWQKLLDDQPRYSTDTTA